MTLYENVSGGSRVVTYGQTDRRTESNSHFSQFSESTKNAVHKITRTNMNVAVY
jgi:hypothetical protein